MRNVTFDFAVELLVLSCLREITEPRNADKATLDAVL